MYAILATWSRCTFTAVFVLNVLSIVFGVWLLVLLDDCTVTNEVDDDAVDEDDGVDAV